MDINALRKERNDNLKSHPLRHFGIKFRGYKSFESEFCDLGVCQPINVIIGRNNSGKSSVVGALGVVSSHGKAFISSRHGNNQKLEIIISETITEEHVDAKFSKNALGHPFNGNHNQFGKRFIGERLERVFGPDFVAKRPADGPSAGIDPHAFTRLSEALGLNFTKFKTIVIPTERKVAPEVRNALPHLQPDGTGVTNVVRAFLNQDSLPRDEISKDLLADLNKVYRGDAEFVEIFCQENDDDLWEIFLSLDDGREVRLSESGSSLQSVFTILCVLRLGHTVQNIDWEEVTFCVEEPENNMHPSLLRRLLEHLATERDELGFCLFITTHSPICIDWAAKRDDSRIVHVLRSSSGTIATAAPTNTERRRILDDLDLRASDLLQANGIIWVEGPSDRIYMRRWISLASNGSLIEGVHYSIMFYGGRLLSHLQAIDPSESESDALISLITLNRNMAVLIDSDRKSINGRPSRMHLNDTKQRIRRECESAGAMVWITQGREIENYLSERVLSQLIGSTLSAEPYAQVSEIPELKKKLKDKISLAHKAADILQLEDLDTLDLGTQVSSLCARIRAWNALDNLERLG
ncbi:ATP-dependent nuclease [Hyphomonas oceanitis]|uniref:ATP-dependent nuclease n=1 Tax=Hyphomonas oceanitis TaxID=81033 RepID=UPI003001F103